MVAAEDLNQWSFDDQMPERLTVAEEDIRELKPGETIERQAKVNDIQAYRLTHYSNRRTPDPVPFLSGSLSPEPNSHYRQVLWLTYPPGYLSAQN